MLRRLPDDYHKGLSLSIFESTFLSIHDPYQATTDSIDMSEEKADLNGDFPEFRYLAGLIKEEQFVKEAGNSERKLASAYFGIGVAKLRQGYRNPDKAKDYRDEAKDNFDKCAQGTMYHLTAYNWSRAFLDRMNKDPDWPPGPDAQVAPEAPD
jgi:hypothetical protein